LPVASLIHHHAFGFKGTGVYCWQYINHCVWKQTAACVRGVVVVQGPLYISCHLSLVAATVLLMWAVGWVGLIW